MFGPFLVAGFALWRGSPDSAGFDQFSHKMVESIVKYVLIVSTEWDEHSRIQTFLSTVKNDFP
jgi:hypothetical protein